MGWITNYYAVIMAYGILRAKTGMKTATINQLSYKYSPILATRLNEIYRYRQFLGRIISSGWFSYIRLYLFIFSIALI